MNTSILVLNMIPPLVFSDLTSISSSPELERECPREELEPTDSDNSKESRRRRPSNGSLRPSVDPFFEQNHSNTPACSSHYVFFLKYIHPTRCCFPFFHPRCISITYLFLHTYPHYTLFSTYLIQLQT